MRIVFAGTPEFAAVALRAIRAAGHEIVLVLTQPDRPAGRGLKLLPSPVKQWALEQGIAIAQPLSLRLDGKHPEAAAQAKADLLQANADVMVVAAYGLILPQWVLDLMAGQFFDGPPLEKLSPLGGSALHEVKSVAALKLGCLNIHGSLLPRWRGAAPIHRAIEAGDLETGITIMQMDAGLDTGHMLCAEAVPIDPQDTTLTLHDTLAALGGRLVVQTLHDAALGRLRPVKQPTEGVSYAHKITKAEAQLDWSLDAEALQRKVRAFNPAPAAFTLLAGESLKVFQASSVRYENNSCSGRKTLGPGTVLLVNEHGIDVQCGGASVLRLTELQRAGGKRLAAADFVRGFNLQPGMVFGS
jgi:methionyl-tRNA formyltransferase